MPNKRACTLISGKVCLLTLIEPKKQTLPEINVHARLFGTLEYIRIHSVKYNQGIKQVNLVGEIYAACISIKFLAHSCRLITKLHLLVQISKTAFKCEIITQWVAFINFLSIYNKLSWFHSS